jgi:hypothetical protein
MSSSKKPEIKFRLNTALCPLCGKPNNCAVAADPNATECWCESVEFPRELLEQIPENALRKTCVCQNCLENFNQKRK